MSRFTYALDPVDVGRGRVGSNADVGRSGWGDEGTADVREGVVAGLGLQGVRITFIPFSIGFSAPVSAAGVALGYVLEIAGAGIMIGGFALFAKLCAVEFG